MRISSVDGCGEMDTYLSAEQLLKRLIKILKGIPIRDAFFLFAQHERILTGVSP
jgi:hypothetical protein